MKFKPRNGKQFLVVFGAVALMVGVATMVFWERHSSAARFTVAKVNKGAIRLVVNATGTLQAVNTVQVGSRISGTVSALQADFNSRVRKGQVIARLDSSVYQAEVSQARARLEEARANFANAQTRVIAAEAELANERAGVFNADANLAAPQAERDDARDYLSREQELAASGVIAARDLEAARNDFQSAAARFDQAVAEVDLARAREQSSAQSGLAEAQAQVKEAQAQIDQNEASLRSAQVNLDYTIIRSPIDGVVVSRNVDVGQTIVASLQTPVLFTIAGDLARMQALANIDQADIGLITTSSRASFTVDAYPGETFTGAIQQIRLSPQDVDTVVTYNVVIDGANPQAKLKPGMTADIIITVAERDNALRVPNAALSFTPAGVTQDQIRALLREAPGGTPGIVWTPGPDHKPQAREITIGLTDGVNTEVTSGDLEENESIITGLASGGGN